VPVPAHMGIWTATGVLLDEASALLLRRYLVELGPVKGDSLRAAPDLPPFASPEAQRAAMLRMLDWSIGFMGWGKERSRDWLRGYSASIAAVADRARAMDL
jgi:hypothetical protein